MITRFATDDEVSAWDNLLITNPDGGNVFSSHEIAETKAGNGWTPRYIISEGMAVLALEKKIPLLGKFWYVPKGPGVQTTKQLQPLLKSLKPFARTQGVFVVKIEPEIPLSDENRAELTEMGLERTFAVQPNVSTICIDLSPSPVDILAGFSQSTRRMIRQAEKDGVTVQAMDASHENCQKMYAIYTETAAGQFSLRPYEYYERYWQACAATGVGQLFFAYVDDTLVAGVYILSLGAKALYKDGASPRTKIARGVGQYIQWKVIEALKERGVTSYDMHGTPPGDQIEDVNHPKYRLGIFKTGFNKTITDYVGGYELIVKPGAYRVWSAIGERLTLRIHRLVSKSEWY